MLDVEDMVLNLTVLESPGGYSRLSIASVWGGGRVVLESESPDRWAPGHMKRGGVALSVPQALRVAEMLYTWGTSRGKKRIEKELKIKCKLWNRVFPAMIQVMIEDGKCEMGFTDGYTVFLFQVFKMSKEEAVRVSGYLFFWAGTQLIPKEWHSRTDKTHALVLKHRG